MAHNTRMTLPGSVWAFVISGACVLLLMLSFFVLNYTQTMMDRALERAVQTRIRSAGHEFARALHADWKNLLYLEQSVAAASPEKAQGMFDAISGEGSRVSWAGFAKNDGMVEVASKGMLIGADVSSRPWFVAGLKGNFAGDLHEAVLLNDLLGGSEEDPIRFIDLSTPVKRDDGQTVGVIGSHISFEWAESLLTEAAIIRDIDILLVSQSGEVIVSSDGKDYTGLSLQSLRAASAGVQSSDLETWPDGNDYFTSVVPSVTYADLPNFGWRLVGRVDPKTFASDRDGVLEILAAVISFGMLLLVIGTAFFVRVFVRPITVLSDSATAISDGSQDYPPEFVSTQEAAKLSAALARIQSRD